MLDSTSGIYIILATLKFNFVRFSQSFQLNDVILNSDFLNKSICYFSQTHGAYKCSQHLFVQRLNIVE